MTLKTFSNSNFLMEEDDEFVSKILWFDKFFTLFYILFLGQTECMTPLLKLLRLEITRFGSITRCHDAMNPSDIEFTLLIVFKTTSSTALQWSYDPSGHLPPKIICHCLSNYNLGQRSTGQAGQTYLVDISSAQHNNDLSQRPTGQAGLTESLKVHSRSHDLDANEVVTPPKNLCL